MSLDVYLYITVNNDDGKNPAEIELFSRNITHNLNTMAGRAGIYYHLWRPEEIGIEYANQLIEPLSDGLERLKRYPDYYQQFNATNGWGMYEHFVPFVEAYLEACREYPGASINVSR